MRRLNSSHMYAEVIMWFGNITEELVDRPCFMMVHVPVYWTCVPCPKKPKWCGPQNAGSGGHVRTATRLIASEINVQMTDQLDGDIATRTVVLQEITSDVTLCSNSISLDPAISVRGNLHVEHISLALLSRVRPIFRKP